MNGATVTEVILDEGGMLFQNNFLNMLAITVIVGAIAVVAVLVAVWISKSKEPEKMEKMANTVKTVLQMGGSFLDAIDKDPNKDNFMEKMQKYALIAVTGMEQTASWSKEIKDMNEEDRRWYLRSQATNTVKQLMKKSGVDIDDVDDATVGTMIDWAVKYANEHGWFQPEKENKELTNNS